MAGRPGRGARVSGDRPHAPARPLAPLFDDAVDGGTAAAETLAAGIGALALDGGEAIWLGEARSGRIVWASETVHAAWALPRRPLRIDDLLRRVHPEDRAALEASGARLAAGESVELELRVRGRSGPRDVLARLTPLAPPDPGGVTGGGTETRYAAVALDVTERRAAERARSREDRRSRELLEALDLYAVMVDRDGRVTFANEALAEATGRSREELEGSAAPVALLRRGRVANPGSDRAVTVEAELEAGDGSLREVAWSLAPLRDEAGAAVGVAAIGRDVTDARRSEREAVALHGRLLERLVRAREQERTRVAREVHDEAVQLLSAGAMEAELLATRAEPEFATPLLGLAEDLRASLARLRLLLFDLHPGSLAREGLAPALRRLAAERERLGGPPARVVDRTRRPLDPVLATILFRVAQDALANAVRHAQAGRIEIELLDRAGGTLLTVTDDGSGFDPAAPDGQGEAGGLAAMRERLELAGGRLAIHARPGSGTRVEAWVPRAATPGEVVGGTP